jgi:hypothetical protein
MQAHIRGNAQPLECNLRLFLVLVALFALGAYGWIYASGAARDPARSDGFCNFVYLPSWVVHHDTTLTAVANERFGGRYSPAYQITWRPGTGRWLNAHQAGVAVLCLPAFAAAHAAAAFSGGNADGFSPLHQHAAGLAGVVYLVAGLWVLARLLRRYFRPSVVLATLVCATFGTNLFHYATYDSLWSHVFSFWLVACLLALVDEWSARPAVRTALLIGVTGGLLALVREASLLFLVFVPLFGVTGWASFTGRLAFLRARWRDVGLMAALAIVVFLPQWWLFFAATRQVAGNPYEAFLRTSGIRQAFDFARPHILSVLFGPEKGLFFWSPILLLAIAGLFLVRGRARGFTLPLVLYFAAQTYLVASWFDWQFGASFGHRAFTEATAALAVPMAAVFEWAADRPRARVALAALATLAVLLSLAQMLQYWLGILPGAGVTLAQYGALFLRFR